MAHEISTGPHPNLMVIRIHGDVTRDDLNLNAELGLGSGRPLYLLVDLTEMALGIPENFLESARNSPFSHADVKHTAACLRAGPVASLVKLVPKLTHQREKVTVFGSYDEAQAHLLTLIRNAGL